MALMETEADLLLAVEQMIERDRYRPGGMRWGLRYDLLLRQNDGPDQWVTRHVWVTSRTHAAERLRQLRAGAGVLGQQLSAGRLRSAELIRGKPLIRQDKPELERA